MTIKIYEVGGSIRDELMGIKSSDRDFSVEADSFLEVLDYIEGAGGKIFQVRPEFLTVRALVPGLGAADFVMCRKDGTYTDGRRPDEVIPGTIFDDLARRDFTMNAIARNIETGELIDPYDGQQDIEDRVIRCVGLPKQRFTEDSLRIIRAYRFAVTKRAHISSAIYEYFTVAHLSWIYKTSGAERIRAEIVKAFKFDTTRALQVMVEYYPALIILMEMCDIWLKPTNEAH